MLFLGESNNSHGKLCRENDPHAFAPYAHSTEGLWEGKKRQDEFHVLDEVEEDMHMCAITILHVRGNVDRM